MAKKLIYVWLPLLILLFSSISIYADENVQGDFFVKHVVINGEEIINYNLQYPFILYGNSMYFPLTPEMGEICGFSAEMDWESRTLKLLKTESTRKNISNNWLKNNNVDIVATKLTDVTVTAEGTRTPLPEEAQAIALGEELANLSAQANTSLTVYQSQNQGQSQTQDQANSEPDAVLEGDDEIQTILVSFNEVLDLGDLPVLMSGSYLYLPLRAMTSATSFDWDIYFDGYYGVCVSTDPTISASTYCDMSEVLLNKGLVSYMQNANGGLSTSVAQNILFFFKRSADVYSIDEKLLMAIGRKESSFNWAARGKGSGPVGIMQIMPSTGARFGLTLDQLYDPYLNISFGAMYISERVNAYGGDLEKGLSAYNQGSAKVNRGNYSKTYSTKILTAYDSLNNYLVTSGYVAAN